MTNAKLMLQRGVGHKATCNVRQCFTCGLIDALEQAEKERQHYVDAHASVKGGLVELRKERNELRAEVEKWKSNARDHELNADELQRCCDELRAERDAAIAERIRDGKEIDGWIRTANELRVKVVELQLESHETNT